jgi:hypothetical protein
MSLKYAKKTYPLILDTEKGPRSYRESLVIWKSSVPVRLEDEYANIVCT